MVALVLVVDNVLFVSVFFLIVDSFFFIGIIVVWLEPTHCVVVLAWFPVLRVEAVLGLPHLFFFVIDKHRVFVVHVVLVGAVFLILLLFPVFDDNIILLLQSLCVLDVVRVELALQEVNVSELFNVDVVESFELRLESFVLLLVLRLDILDALEALLRSLKFLLSSLELVQEATLIELEVLDSVLHFSLLLSLIIDDVPDALLDVDLLGVRIEVPRDRVEELQSLVPRLL